MHQTLLCLESGLSKRTLLGRKVTLLVRVQYFKVAPSIYETSLNLVFNFSPNFMWAHGLLNTLAYGYQSNCTPPNSEIICGRNVNTKVVCGMILFFKKKAMLKI